MRNPSPSSMKTPAKSSSTTPCCSKVGLKRGPWTPEEDELLSSYIKREGEGKWRTLPNKAGLLRCGKSCRLRWMNYLKPTIKRGDIGEDEEDLIVRLHRLLGNRWSLIAGRIPGRTDNEIKNYWNTHLSKKLISQGVDPRTHKPLNPNQTMIIPPNPELNPNPNPNPLSIQETTTNTTSNIGGCSMDGVSDDLHEFMEEDMFQQHNSDICINAYNNYGSPVPSLPAFGHGAFWEDIVSSFSDFF